MAAHLGIHVTWWLVTAETGPTDPQGPPVQLLLFLNNS